MGYYTIGIVCPMLPTFFNYKCVWREREREAHGERETETKRATECVCVRACACVCLMLQRVSDAGAVR